MSKVAQLLEFFDAPAAASFGLSNSQAISYFKSKGLKVTFDWRDMLGDEHANAFTVAKMADIDLLADVQASLDDALANGLSFDQWKKTIVPTLQQKGWWGKQAQTDPLTGATINAQLGSPARLKTIFRTNVQGAYAAGTWQQMDAQKELAPYLMYDAVDDHRTRPDHAAWDGTILPMTHEWWKSHYPPNGWNCRCGTIQLSDDDLEDLGLNVSSTAPGGGQTYTWTNPRTGKTQKIPKGLDPGWNSNPGAVRLDQLQALAAEKLKGLTPKQATAGAKGLKSAGVQAQEAAEAQGIAVAPTINLAPSKAAAGAGKAQVSAAEAAIAKALTENTPYLAKSLQKIQASKAGQAMGPIEQLQAAQADALKVKDASALAVWKQAKLQGKPGAASGQAVFDALPEPAQAAMLEQIDAALAAKAGAKATDDALAAIESGAMGPLQQKQLAYAKANFPDKTPADLLAYMGTQPAKLTAGQQAGGLAGWKKNAIAGKPPTEKQQMAFDSLNDTQKANALAQVDAAKAEVNASFNAAIAKLQANENWKDDEELDPVTGLTAQQKLDEEQFNKWMEDELQDDVIPPGPDPISDVSPDINPAQLVQIGPQKGSNAGGSYVDQATGTEWYVKFPASEDVARNELLASKLYELAGIEAPDLRYITVDGKPAIASRMVAGLKKGTPAQLTKGGAFDGFATDAWLGNWDVAGATMDNLLLNGARAFRVDVGGSLRYRAQGGLKGNAWSNDVTELQSLRNTGTSPQGAKVFGKMTDADIEASARKVLVITDAEIDRAVDQYGPRDALDASTLKATLKARRDAIGKAYPNAKPTVAAPAVPPDVPDTARITAREQADIEASRVNGYTVRTDGDQVEDQSVIVSTVQTASGKPQTRLFLKVRGDGEKAIERLLPQGAQAANVVDLSDVRAKMVGLLKSINSRANAGKTVDVTVYQKWEALQPAMKAAIEQLKRDGLEASAKPMAKKLEAMRKEFLNFVQDASKAKQGVPIQAFRQVDVDEFRNIKVAPAKGGTDTGLPWQKGTQLEYELAEFTKANARMTGKLETLPGVNSHFELQGEGYRVRYVPGANNAISSRGVVMIEIDGTGTTASAKGFEILEKIGVRATRSTEAERVELYLDRIAYIRTLRNKTLDDAYKVAGAIADPAKRAAAKLRLLNADAGLDMTKSRFWNPDGEHQAFGHGRVLLNRPDLDDKDVASFAKQHVVYTSVTGLRGGSQWTALKSIIESGGQMGSQIDRMRRGVASFGSSVESDHGTGGANYIFTRLKARKSADYQNKRPGVYWNPERVMRRSDAFTYDGDMFGRVARASQEASRAKDVDGWRAAARAGNNETNFRDSLSLFDGVERIVLDSKPEYLQAIGDMRALGYRTWPDGRALDDVFDYKGSNKP